MNCTIFIKKQHILDLQLDITLATRQLLLKNLNSLSKEALFTIPQGCNNHIFWNIAHVVVTQQLLVYKLSGVPMLISDSLVDKYKKGTKPDGAVASDEEIETIKTGLISCIEQTRKDHDNGAFNQFHPYETSAGVTLKSAADAVSFNLFHEGIHLGSILAIKRMMAL